MGICSVPTCNEVFISSVSVLQNINKKWQLMESGSVNDKVTEQKSDVIEIGESCIWIS